MPTDEGLTAARLGDYYVLIRRQWAAVLLGLVLGVAVALAYLVVAPREYTSVTAVLVTATDADSVGGTGRDEINLDTEAQLLTSTETVSAAAEALDVPADELDDLADRVGVTVPPNTEILRISFVGSSAQSAQAGARAFADAYLDGRRATAEDALELQDDALQERIDVVGEQLRQATEAVATLPNGTPERGRAADQAAALNQQLASLGAQQNQVRSETVSPGRVVTRATLPASPSSPDRYVTLAAGVVLGGLLGLGAAVLRHRRDDVLRDTQDVQRRTGVRVVAAPETPLPDGQVRLAAPLSADGRAHARLRNHVTTALAEAPRRVVLVAGTRRGGGTVAANLAASLARSGEEVVLVCADVFGATATSLLGDRPRAGLAEVLAGNRTAPEVAERLTALRALRVVGPGLDADRADALLQTRNPRAVVDALLQDGADVVVIEAPATTEDTSVQTLANVAEIAVLVLEAGRTTARDVTAALGQLESMGTPVVGAVLVRHDDAPAPGADEPAPQGTDAPAPRAPRPADRPDRERPRVAAAPVADPAGRARP
ncbi:Wzz/FepE/Etk N-terminal domain-containing protein [Blastococcus sp. KM273128]|uniref:Wzz/FepE/Etk N-terminal domain-containing protein n=1 Tax=Blastococcus sp. KM273128 TaxID=2570314 RepID=UPI001F337CA0|nr:Wzz/FepE/Etk N-terminal domain-containing protein [Blastococcus sp. KM273128]